MNKPNNCKVRQLGVVLALRDTFANKEDRTSSLDTSQESDFRSEIVRIIWNRRELQAPLAAKRVSYFWTKVQFKPHIEKSIISK